MRNEFQFELEKLNLRHRRKRVWYRIISVLCSIAVFVTTYALILPAITLEASSDSFIIEEKLPQIYELSDGKLKECQELSEKNSINIESFIGRTIYLNSTQEIQNIYFSGDTSSFKVNNSDYINFDSDTGLLTIQKDIPKGTTVILGSELSEESINIKIIDECSVSFDVNGGNGAFEKITGSSDEIYTLPKEEPIFKDKCFIGWKAPDGTIYKSGNSYKFIKDTALVAQWEDIDYGVYESTYQKVLKASTLDELWSILGDREFEDFWISLHESEQAAFEKKYQKLLNDTASQQELTSNSETLSVSVSGKLPKDSVLKLNSVSEKMSNYIKENLQGLEDELPFEVKLDTLDISVVDKYGHKFTPSEPLKMNIKKLNGSYDSEKYDLFVAHLMDDTLAIDRAIDSDMLQFAELSEESLPLFKDELNAVPSSAEKSDDSIAYTEHKAESNQDGSITIPVESFSIYQVASVNVTTGTYIKTNSTIEMNVGESRVFYENTNESHATWTVTDPTDAVLWNLHDPGKQIENEKWMQKYVWIKITAQHPADKITVTAKYGNNNKSEKFYISIPEPKFYIQNSIPKDGNISVHSNIQNVVSYKWSKESGKIVDEAIYQSDTSRINVTIDMGGGATYTVQGYDKDGNPIDSAKASFTVPYCNELKNGSFEYPIINGDDNTRYVGNGFPNVYWKTTGMGKDTKIGQDIEFGNPTETYMPAGNRYAANGNQFAELNAEAYGALYQDIMTVPGTTLYWSVAHRGRDGKDTMIVSASNRTDVSNIITQSELLNYINGKGSKDKLKTMTDGNADWSYYTGSYNVPEGQYVTRFWFIATDAVGGTTRGNLLDAISFSTEIPWRIEYYLDGEIQNSLTETGNAQLGDYISASNTDDELLKNAVFIGSTIGTALNDESGNIREYNGTQIYIHKRIEDGKIINVLRLYYVTTSVITAEKTVTVDGWNELTADEKQELFKSLSDGTYDVDFKLKLNKDNSWSDIADAKLSVDTESLSSALTAGKGTAVFSVVFKDSNGDSYYPTSISTAKTFTAEESSCDSLENYKHSSERTSDEKFTISRSNTGARKVSFKNTYEPETLNLKVTKEVIGVKTTEEFPFNVSYTIGEKTSSLGNFNLADGNSKTFKVPIGARLTISELSHNGYSVLIRKNGITKTNDDSYSFDIKKGTEIVVQNVAGTALPETSGKGIHLFIYGGLLLMAGTVMCEIILRCRWKRRSDM